MTISFIAKPRSLELTLLALSVALTSCSSSPPLASFGDPCSDDAACESSICSTDSFCTDTCSAEIPCAESTVCGPDGLCQRPCSERSTLGNGASREICVAGLFVACSGRDAVADCNVCGCEPFGGGVCLSGRGCVPPAPDGTACTTAAECESGVCYGDTRVCGVARADGEMCGAGTDCASRRCFSDTDTCGPPRPDGSACSVDADCATGNCLSDATCGAPREIGGSCHIDADCATANCSTNGEETSTGVCHQQLGSACELADSTCQNCMNAGAFSSGRCFRYACDPVDAPSCPNFDGHAFECQESVNPGEYYCYERCTPDFDGDSTTHRCYRPLATCLDGTTFCR